MISPSRLELDTRNSFCNRVIFVYDPCIIKRSIQRYRF